MLVLQMPTPEHGDSDSSRISTSTSLPDAGITWHAKVTQGGYGCWVNTNCCPSQCLVVSCLSGHERVRTLNKDNINPYQYSLLCSYWPYSQKNVCHILMENNNFRVKWGEKNCLYHVFVSRIIRNHTTSRNNPLHRRFFLNCWAP